MKEWKKTIESTLGGVRKGLLSGMDWFLANAS